MCQISIKIPDAVLYDTYASADEAVGSARHTVAMSYYTQNNVSIDYCAQIASITGKGFIKYLGRNQISTF